jgi:nickel-dependent lactate racemase
MRINLPQLLWFENNTLEIDLPESWDVEYCPMNGETAPPLSQEKMAEAIINPIGSPRIRDLAKGKQKAVIVFDDMTRPTRVYELAPTVISELLAGGISEDNITFVCALGTHGALTAREFRKKLGTDIIERFRVFNHNIYENCVEVGTTSRGTKVMINREVMEADLKIVIGCVTAHPQTGFSGGGKIILPGVAHVDSIAHYHLEVEASAKETTGLGNFDNNVMRFDIEEAARMVNVDFGINVMFNGRGQTTHVFAGELFEAYNQAVAIAKDHYAAVPLPQGKNVVVANAFAKPNEMPIAILLGVLALDNFTGTIVVLANSPEGQVVHYLLGRFGSQYGGRQYPVGVVPPSVNVIIMAPYLDRNFGDWVSNPEVITFTRSWDETLQLLKEKQGDSAKVAILPNATMQYYKF